MYSITSYTCTFTIFYHGLHKSTTAEFCAVYFLVSFVRLFLFPFYLSLPINVLPQDIRQFFFRLLALTAFSQSVHLLHYHYYYTLFTHLFENGRGERKSVFFFRNILRNLNPLSNVIYIWLKVVITYYSSLHSYLILGREREDREMLSEKKGEEIMKPLLDLCWILFFFSNKYFSTKCFMHFSH